jgi:hypothetical protein
MRTFGLLTIANGVLATVASCAAWAVYGPWWLIPPFVLVGAAVVVLGWRVVQRSD